jgi:hypothetical protein
MYLVRRATQAEVAARVGNGDTPRYRYLLWPPDPRAIEQAAVSTGGSIYYRPLGSLLPPFKEIFDQFRRSYIVCATSQRVWRGAGTTSRFASAGRVATT